MSEDRWLSPLFLGDLDPHLRASFESLVDPDLERLLALAFEAGRLAWPGVALDPERYVQHLARVIVEVQESAERTLTSLHAADLFVACACGYGDATAVATLERELISKLDAPLRSTGLAPDSVDEVKQRIREFLLVGAHGVPGITEYRGRGQLRSWLRAIALRQAMMQFREQRGTPSGDEDLHELPAISADPQLAPWKEQYAAAFRVAFEQAIAALDERQRTLLRQHHLDHLSIDALAKVHHVHRATAARWIAAAREELLAGVRERVTEQLAISGSELASVLRMARSQLDVSIHRLLGAKRQRKS